MREIGVRELERTMSATIRAVGQGEMVRVTVRGSPLVDIVPTGASAGNDRLHQLVAAGRVTPPARSRPDRAPRIAVSERMASDLVLGERAGER